MSREKKSRRQFTTEQTAATLRRHLVDPASELCNCALYGGVWHRSSERDRRRHSFDVAQTVFTEPGPA